MLDIFSVELIINIHYTCLCSLVHCFDRPKEAQKNESSVIFNYLTTNYFIRRSFCLVENKQKQMTLREDYYIFYEAKHNHGISTKNRFGIVRTILLCFYCYRTYVGALFRFIVTIKIFTRILTVFLIDNAKILKSRLDYKLVVIIVRKFETKRKQTTLDI